jgi:hypothetical protein
VTSNLAGNFWIGIAIVHSPPTSKNPTLFNDREYISSPINIAHGDDILNDFGNREFARE